MSITASTCITFAGYEPLGNTLTLYSNIDNFVSPFGTVLLTSITGNSCPYIMSGIPNGTTSVQLRDPVSLCCTTIFLQNNDLCNNCNLSISSYQTSSVSQLVAGFLAGDCDDNISDYIINWYRTGSSEVVLTTGYGTEFTDIGWDLTHPLTGNSSPIVEPGTYYPVIERVIINGITYSNSGGTGLYPANLDCFSNQKISVSAIECGQGNNIGDYSHHYLFDNYSVGVPPDSLSTTFNLSSNVNYIAWQFRGFQIYDTLKFTFYGSEYNNVPLTIENVRIGSGAGQPSVGPNSNPKIITSELLIKKVTCLTGLTINEGDYISIEVIPNQIFYNTKWDFYFTCLETFDCSTCYDQFQNSSPKIDLSTIEVNLLPCDQVSVYMQVSGCNYTNTVTTDVGKYFLNPTPNTYAAFKQNLFLGQSPMCFSATSCVQQQCNYYFYRLCGPTGGTYSFNKSIVNGQGKITFTFNLNSDLQHYYNSYLAIANCLTGSTSNTELSYYNFFTLIVPIPNSVNEQCGDTTPYREYYIHHTSVVTVSGTGPYTMIITMPTIVKNINFTDCQLNCENNIQWIVNAINVSSLNSVTNLSFTTNTGSKWLNPFRNKIRYNLQSNADIANYDEDFITNWQFQNETYVYSGNNILISSLTGQTCPYRGKYENNYFGSGGYGYFQYSGAWKVELTNPNNLTEFTVTVAPITNWIPPTLGNGPDYNTTALTYSNGTVTYSNPDYTF